jgi:hypothetical protein
MAFENLPGIFPNWIDGNLQIAAVSEAPVVLVLGTCPRGDTESLYRVNSVSDASRVFGRQDGTLIRGLYEVYAGGATNMRLMRVGATPATLSAIGSNSGSVSGLTVTTLDKDADAGAAYKIFWDDSELRLRVWRSVDDGLVYDNNPAYPSAAVDENEVSVTGLAETGDGDIGSLSVPLSLADADGVGGASYSAGADGITLSRMELFEALFNAYKLLENEDLDVIVPRNVYLDDASIADMTTAEVSALNSASSPWVLDTGGTAYPEPGSDFDALGKVFAQEYNGEWFFWWDLDRDGVAELFPSVGSADASTDAYGQALELANFHEANFGYQLADFCYRQSEDNAEMIGTIGMLPPASWSLKDVSNWIGRLPVYTEDSAGNLTITSSTNNGSGLLGNKWMAGRKGSSVTGLPGHIVNGVDGIAYGGFIGTDSGWPDGAQQEDRNEHLIDIGKYISVVGAQGILANTTAPSSYAASCAALYAGFVSSLAANSAPTNKVIPGVRLPFRVSVAKLDDLAGLGYVMFQQKTKGIVVSDAPTASRPDSDYQRLSTVRIVKATIDAIRNVADPFLGEPITGARLAALETAINQALVKLQKLEYLQRFEALVSSTPTQQVQGQADVELILVPAFELRQITVYVSLAAQ